MPPSVRMEPIGSLFRHRIVIPSVRNAPLIQAVCRARANTGQSSPARIAINAITTGNSTRVKPRAPGLALFTS